MDRQIEQGGGLTGSLPTTISEMSQAKKILLNHNKFSGLLEEDSFWGNASFIEGKEVSLAQNNFFCPLPAWNNNYPGIRCDSCPGDPPSDQAITVQPTEPSAGGNLPDNITLYAPEFSQKRTCSGH